MGATEGAGARFPYHCGIVVEDLDLALERFEAGLGIAFREPEPRALRPAPGYEGAIAAGSPVRFAFSVGSGYPYLELIEAQRSGLFRHRPEAGVHHVGSWVGDMAGVAAEQAAAGLPTLGSFDDEDGVQRVFYSGDGQLTLESVNARLRPDYESWLAGGVARKGAIGGSAEPYHVAYLVADLDVGMPHYEALLGVEFREPMKRLMRTAAEPGKADATGPEIEVDFTYSIAARPPYVELIAMQEEPVFGPERREGFHHIGIWVPQLDAAREALLRAGGEVEARFFSPDGVERVCFVRLDGVRAEFVNEAIREQTEEWLPKGSRRRG